MSKLILIPIGFINVINLIFGIAHICDGLCSIYYAIRDRHKPSEFSLKDEILDEVLDIFFITGILSVISMIVFLAYLFGLISIDTFRFTTIICYLICSISNLGPSNYTSIAISELYLVILLLVMNYFAYFNN